MSHLESKILDIRLVSGGIVRVNLNVPIDINRFVLNFYSKHIIPSLKYDISDALSNP